MRALLLVTLALAACGGVAVTDPAPCPAPDASPPPVPDASPLDASVPDASPLDASDASDASDAATCKPHLGHCITNQATYCYETEGDEAAEAAKCNATGLSSGWHLGPCETGWRSNGGCQVGCLTEWRYPLGSGPSTLATRAWAKEACEVNQGGVYLPPTEPVMGRYLVNGDEVLDRETGITWYRRFLYGSAFVPAPDVCVGLPGVSPMRRATVAEAMTILVFRPDGQVQWDDPFQWSNAIASQASDGCVNLPPFSVTGFDECQGDLINRLCVKQ